VKVVPVREETRCGHTREFAVKAFVVKGGDIAVSHPSKGVRVGTSVMHKGNAFESCHPELLELTPRKEEEPPGRVSFEKNYKGSWDGQTLSLSSGINLS